MESNPNKFAQPFLDMAARVQRTPETEFSGAIVIVPPEGDPVAVMVTDPKRDLAAFWAVAQSKIDIGIAEFQANQPRSGGYPGGRR